MDHQEWFEKFKVQLNYDDNRFYEPIWKDGNWRWQIIQSALFKMAIHMLPFAESKVLNLIFFNGLSERETAQKLKIPKTRAHRIKIKALKSLARSAFVKLALSPRALKRKMVRIKT